MIHACKHLNEIQNISWFFFCAKTEQTKNPEAIESKNNPENAGAFQIVGPQIL